MDAASQSRIGLLVVHNTRHKKIHQHSVCSSQARLAINISYAKWIVCNRNKKVPRKVIKYVDLFEFRGEYKILPFLTVI